ncbi:MAG: ornithine carbamoyltransferase [Gammaproteobacteria bacterium RIFCSPLOWO2_12_FULL_52_10]|nr:MAG: ornithine carbamoyltransferase [Gammaproteobacteria bacterium RIFCSPLOWO2_12_FULL_52_10]
MSGRHFLSLNDFSSAELRQLIRRACELKQQCRNRAMQQTHPGRVLAMIFEKSSTRTRVSFETAMAQLGGHTIFLSPQDSQLGRGEPLADTARVLSKMVDCVMIRTYEHGKLEEFARHSTIPVINGLSDTYHPCQLLADMQTYYELRGDISGRQVCWLGDGNNMCNSYINAARMFDFTLRIACPVDYRPRADMLNQAAGKVTVTDDPQAAIQDADLVVTDVWASMGQEQESSARKQKFSAYQVNQKLLALAADDALFMHCLPAHRGEEVTAEVIDGPHSVVWEEAGNRLHTQKALLEFLLS